MVQKECLKWQDDSNPFGYIDVAVEAYKYQCGYPDAAVEPNGCERGCLGKISGIYTYTQGSQTPWA